jgi:DamX protein
MSTDDTKRHSAAFETDSAVAEFAALLERHSSTLAAPTSSDSNVDGTEILFSLERIQRFELLLHLVANLQQPLVLCGPAGIGKTTFLGLLIDKAFDNWQVVSIQAGNGLSYSEAIAHIAEQLALSHASEHAVVEALQQRARAEGLLVLLLDNAGKLEPGVITSLWQLARHHPALRPVLALRPEEVQRKTISDGIALGDCHFVDIPALDEAGCEAFLQRLASRPPRLLALEEVNSARVRSLLQASQGVPGQIVALLSPAKSSARRAAFNYIGLALAVLAALGLTAAFAWRWYVQPGQASKIWETLLIKLHSSSPQPNPIPEGKAANVALSERPPITAAPQETAQPEPAPAPPLQQTPPLAIEIAPASQATPVPPPQPPQEETRAPLPVTPEPAPSAIPEPAPAAITPAPAAPSSAEPAAAPPPIAASAPAVVPAPPVEPIPASPPTIEPAAVAAKTEPPTPPAPEPAAAVAKKTEPPAQPAPESATVVAKKTEPPAQPASEQPAEPVVTKPAPVKTPAAPPKEKGKAPAISAPSKSSGKAPPAPPPAVKPPPAAAPAADTSSISGIQDAGWLMAQPAQSYTLLIMSAREPASVKTLLARYPAMKGRLAAYKKSGNALYHVYYGLFASEAEAQQATAQLPASLGKPVPRSLKAVQQDLRAKP